jgi:hypothetical protein
VSNDYKEGENKFTGSIKKITIDTKPVILGENDKKKIEEGKAAAAAAQQ